MTPDQCLLMFRLYESLIDEGRGWKPATANDMDHIHEAALSAYLGGHVTAHSLWDNHLMSDAVHAEVCDCYYAENFGKKDTDD